MGANHTKDHCKQLLTISTTLATNKQETDQDMEVCFIHTRSSLAGTIPCFFSSQAYESKVQESCSGLQSSLESLASGGVSQAASRWTKDTAAVSSAIAQFADTQGSHIAEARTTVSQFVSQELAVDKPTGTYMYYIHSQRSGNRS